MSFWYSTTGVVLLIGAFGSAPLWSQARGASWILGDLWIREFVWCISEVLQFAWYGALARRFLILRILVIVLELDIYAVFCWSVRHFDVRWICGAATTP